MCTRGRVCVRSPLPSLVTMTLLPVSAIRKLAPVMPTSAARKRSRSLPRASTMMSRRSAKTRSAGRSVCIRRKSASQSSRFRWKAGAMMWDGCSRRSWRMYSPRSVSTGAMPCASRCSFTPISSEIIDLPLVTVRAPALRQIPRIGRPRVLRRGAPVDGAARPLHRGGVALQVVVEVGQGVVLDVPADLAQPLEFRQGGDGDGAALEKGALGGAERLLQPGIRHGPGGVLLEGGRGDLHGRENSWFAPDV